MKIYYSSKFEKEYQALSKEIKEKATMREKIFRRDPFDQRLKTHKLKGILSGFWAFSIDYQYRIIFEFRDKKTAWFHSVGTHEIYR